ncbi:hypothetical protein MPH_08481 [Macrophomina phaseolina MS6]|uniref:DUF7703 domain-containing protein n=1 Tax=Macrophomina phaseolina (strain MS6) TaxID=1126212 RepID=K2QWS2_MACPH|nr:hypothetical protein MPH_08481 [Macrophomina phaseolina MS6]
MPSADSGISHELSLSYPTLLTITSFLAIALYNFVALNFLVFLTFRQRSGLYFWSFLVATWGVAPYCIGFLLKYQQLTDLSFVYVTLIVAGWYAMVTGQSVVLYSRLHVLVRNTNRLRWVLIMIISNALIGHVPTTILVYGANSNNPKPFIVPYSVYEKVQVTVFFVQEVIISLIYLYETMRTLRPEGNIRRQQSRRLLKHLIYINIIIIIMDVTLLGVEYAGYYDIQTTYKAFVYSTKLQMEFRILNGLVEMTQAGISQSSSDRQQSNRPVPLVSLSGRPKPMPGMGYSAYAQTEENRRAEPEEPMSVMKTTEVVVDHNSAPSTNGDSRIELDSLELGRTDRPAPRRCFSASSSQVNFAKSDV